MSSKAPGMKQAFHRYVDLMNRVLYTLNELVYGKHPAFNNYFSSLTSKNNSLKCSTSDQVTKAFSYNIDTYY